MRTYGRLVIKSSVLLTLVSCGKGLPSSSATASLSADPAASLNFTSWCMAWNLSCPSEQPPEGNVPPPLSKAKTTSLLTIVRAVGASPSELTLDRSDVEHPAIAATVAALDLTSAWNSFRERLNEAQFTSLTLSGGSLVVQSAESTTTPRKSGLLVKSAPQLSISIDQDLTLKIKGLTLTSSNGQSESLDSLTLNGDNTADWQSANLKVTQSPLAFLGREVFGVSSTRTEAKKDIGFKDLVPLILPLTEWLDGAGPRNLDIERDQVAIIQAEVPTLVQDKSMQQQLVAILGKIQSIQSTKSSRSDHLLQVTSSDEIHCNVEDKADITLASQFGIGHVTRSDGADDTLVSIEVEGFQITLPGPLPLPIAISRIDLAPHKIYIRDLPIIGSIGIDLDQLPKGGSDSKAPKITCN